MTAADHFAGPARSPWERWGWVVAGVWLVFLTYPVLETFQTDASAAVKGLVLALLASFAAIYLLGWGVWRKHGLLIWLAMLVLALATVPVIGIEAIGLTPYLGAFSALMVPAPWWKWTTLVSALLPVLSLVGGDFPAFFFLMVWPIIGFCAAMRVFTELEEQSEETRAELALVAERDRVARDVHDVLGHSLTALSHQGRARGPAHRRRPRAGPPGARVDPGDRPAGARRGPRHRRRPAGGQPRGRAGRRAPGARRRRHRDAGRRHRRRHRPTAPHPAGLGAARVGDQRGPARARVDASRSSSAPTRHDRRRRRHRLRADDRREGNGLRGMRERVSAAGGTLRPARGGPGTRVEVVLP